MELNNEQRRRGRWKMLAILAVCALPLIASYFTYYVIKPGPSTNYGTLLDPRSYPVPRLDSATLDGKPTELDAYKGKWIMLQVDSGNCAAPCQKKLHDMRQLRTAQGKERERVERVWMITDKEPLDTMLMREYDGTRMLRVRQEALQGWLPVEQGASLADHIYMIDPLGNLMMRFPKDADPNRIKKDLGRLLKASKVG
ncbi:MAG TPA: cytochrome C oxidase subunit I [Oxalobacteraceae bacterium]|nr:cytochrome C oxidase subunit I [Oxalobacteraceae bacterium]